MLQPSEMLFCENDSPQDSRREQIRPETEKLMCIVCIEWVANGTQTHIEAYRNHMKSLLNVRFRLEAQKITPPTMLQ